MISFTIPLPKDLLSEGNKHDHWSQLHRRNKRKDKYLQAYWPKKTIALPCHVKFYRIAPRKLDPDNLGTTIKHYQDWIADKIIPGLAPGRADGDPRITWEYAQEKGEYGLKIEIK